VAGGDIGHGPARWGEVAHGDGSPRNEADPIRFAGTQHIATGLIGDVEAVLDRDDLDLLASPAQLVDRDLRDADEADLALVAKLTNRDRTAPRQGLLGRISNPELVTRVRRLALAVRVRRRCG